MEPPLGADLAGQLEMPRVAAAYLMASADAEEREQARVGSPGELKAAILESAAVKARKVW